MAEELDRGAGGRKTRADAQRNRERLLEVAKAAFARDGADASLDEIARQAGVGVGTLYRHFPTRDVLIEAVYRGAVEKLVGAGATMRETMEPFLALRAWMLLFVDHVAEKKLILPAMNSVPGGSMRMMEGARGSIHSTFRGLIEQAITTGALRRTTDPEDLVRAMIGVFHTTAMPGWEESARRIVELLLAGARA